MWAGLAFIWTHCPLSGLMGHNLEDEPIDEQSGPLYRQDGLLSGQVDSYLDIRGPYLEDEPLY